MGKAHLTIAGVIVLVLLSFAVIDQTGAGDGFAGAVNRAAAEALFSDPAPGMGSYMFVRSNQKLPAPSSKMGVACPMNMIGKPICITTLP